MVKMNSAVELASKLEEAIILGKKGLDTSAWERKLGLLEQAKEVAERTFELLNA